MKNELKDFTPEDRYGSDIFHTEDSKRFEPRLAIDGCWIVAEQKWVRTMEAAFTPGHIYRRPLSLGNEAGEPPQFWLVQWQEDAGHGDEYLYANNPNWLPLMGPPHPVSYWIEELPSIHAIRRRVTAVSEPAAAPASAEPICGATPPPPSLPYLCTRHKGHIGVHWTMLATGEKGASWPQAAPAADPGDTWAGHGCPPQEALTPTMCSKCYGTGWIAPHLGSSNDARPEKCSICNGTGMVSPKPHREALTPNPCECGRIPSVLLINCKPEQFYVKCQACHIVGPIRSDKNEAMCLWNETRPRDPRPKDQPSRPQSISAALVAEDAKVCGEWVMWKDQPPPEDDDVKCQLTSGDIFLKHCLVITNWPPLRWLRLFPEPEPPPLPQKDCCDGWAIYKYRERDLPSDSKSRYCPFCGRPRPAAAQKP